MTLSLKNPTQENKTYIQKTVNNDCILSKP